MLAKIWKDKVSLRNDVAMKWSENIDAKKSLIKLNEIMRKTAKWFWCRFGKRNNEKMEVVKFAHLWAGMAADWTGEHESHLFASDLRPARDKITISDKW
jgi:hypothetical protein